MVTYNDYVFVDLLLSKYNHNGAAAARRFLLVLGTATDACKICTAVLWCVATFIL